MTSLPPFMEGVGGRLGFRADNTANIGRIIAFYWEMCYYRVSDQHTFPQ